MLPAKHDIGNYGELPRNKCGFDIVLQRHERDSANQHAQRRIAVGTAAVHGVCFGIVNVTGSEAQGERQMGRQAWFAFVSQAGR